MEIKDKETLGREEVAARLGCARRTVARRLKLVRTIWQAEVPGARQLGHTEE